MGHQGYNQTWAMIGTKQLSSLLLAALLLGGPWMPARGQMTVVKMKQPLKVAAPVELKGKDLDQYRQYSLADAIRYYSGVQFKDYAGLAGFTTINVRSLGSERMGVFYNGLEIGNTMNGIVDLSKFSLDNIQNIAIYSSQKGDIFQCAKDFASSNSLYITSKRPVYRRDEQRTNFRAQVRGSSTWGITPSFLVETDLGNYTSLSASAEMHIAKNNYPFRYRRRNANGATVIDTAAHRENNDVHALRTEVGLHGIMTGSALSSGTWNFFAYHYSSQRGIPGATINDIWYQGERLVDRSSFLQGSARMDVNSWYRTQIMLKAAGDYIHYTNKDDKLAPMDEAYRQYTGYVSWSNQFTFYDWWKLSFAYDLEFNHMQKRNELVHKADAAFPMPWRLVNLFSLATQFQWSGLTMQLSGLGTYVYNRAAAGFTPEPQEMGVSPAFMIYYKPFKRVDFFLQASAKQTYRVPNYNDRYVSSLIGEHLKPELVQQANFGISYGHGKVNQNVFSFNLSLEGNYQRVKDKIIAFPRGQLFRWSMVNLGLVEMYGGDANASITLSLPDKFHIVGKLQYSYQQAQDVTNKNDPYFQHQIPNIPWHSGSAVLGLSWRGWALDYSFLYTGKRYGEQENIPYNELQPWYTHDISLSKLIKAGEWNFRIMAELNNMLGDVSDLVANYPMPRQVVQLTLTAELQ